MIAALKKVLPVSIVIVLLVAGIGAAWYLTMVKLQLQYHPDYISGCNYSEQFNCDTVQTSDQSEIMGIPITLFAIATYVSMIFLVILAAAVGGQREWALSALFCIGLATCAYSVYLAYISIVVIKAVCTYCILMYGVNFSVTIMAFLALPRSLRSVLNPATYLSLFTSWPVLTAIIVSFGVSFGGVYTFYAGIKTGMIADYIKKTEARTERPPSPEREAPQATKTAATETNIVPVDTGQGISFMNFSITDKDHVKGPADAPVTIVEFADFNCSHCRALFREIAPLEKKYKGRIRWVFKNFPLDQECNPQFRTTHPNACKSSRAAFCASEQGKFWEAHDYLFSGASSRHSDEDLADMVNTLGLDREQFNACLNSDRPNKKIAADVLDGYRAHINGTPRTYINGYLVSGDAGSEILEYYIQKALARASDTSTAMTVPVIPNEHTPTGIPLRTARKSFYMDTFEAATDKQGRAVSLPGVMPAYASWYMARKACEKTGKRLCTEEEWVTACTGVPAVDNNGNGHFTDDNIEGWMFPYGPYYLGGRCHDADSKEGQIDVTGAYPGCISAQGVYDLTGNLSEWAVSATGAPVLLGGYFYLGSESSCRFSIDGLAPGVRNEVTGFRCCSDGPVQTPQATAEDIENIPLGGRVGVPVMDFSFTDQDGRKITRKSISHDITVITLCESDNLLVDFELQSLQQLKAEFGGRGFNFMVFIVNRDKDASKALADSLPFTGPIHIDRDQISMGVFSTRKLPSTYVVDTKGVLRFAAAGGMNNFFDLFRKKLRKIGNLTVDKH